MCLDRIDPVILLLGKASRRSNGKFDVTNVSLNSMIAIINTRKLIEIIKRGKNIKYIIR